MDASSLPSSSPETVTPDVTFNEAALKFESCRVSVIGVALALHSSWGSPGEKTLLGLLRARTAELVVAQQEIARALNLIIAEDLHQ